MNHSTEQLQRRLELIVDRYEMRRTGKSLFAIRHERMKTQKPKLK
jgi:hypothetical protein